MEQLLIGSALMIIGVVSLLACLPRHGKKAWFVGKPLVESGVPILMIAIFAMGVILIAAYFTTIDNATMTGVTKHL